MSLLRHLRITSPCPAPPTLGGPTTPCARCHTVVHNLSALTTEQAEALLATGTVRCVAFRRRPDGTVRTLTALAVASLAACAHPVPPEALAAEALKAEALAAEALAAPQPEPEHLRIEVVDEDGIPVAAARVSIIGGPSGQADDEGVWVVYLPTSGRLDVVIQGPVPRVLQGVNLLVNYDPTVGAAVRIDLEPTLAFGGI